jgi:uncharacterized protein YjiS (DUF1127 family)
MSCAYKTDSSPTVVQVPSPVWPNWPSVTRALAALVDIVYDVIEMQRAAERTCGRLWQRRRERQALLELDDRLLNDVGVSREQAERQARKWFWQ